MAQALAILHPQTVDSLVLASTWPLPRQYEELCPDAPRIARLLTGDIPSPLAPPSGCVFRTRCPLAVEACASAVPPMREAGDGHRFACLRDASEMREAA